MIHFILCVITPVQSPGIAVVLSLLFLLRNDYYTCIVSDNYNYNNHYISDMLL